MFRIELFSIEKEKEWDEFVLEKSLNGTFLQSRRFLNYHPEGRFVDASVMIYNEKNNLAAVCPACECVLDEGKTFYSHGGTTFGGLIVDKKHHNAKRIMQMVEELKKYIKDNDYDCAYIRQTSDIFSSIESDLLQYAFCYNGFIEYKDLSTYVDYATYKEDIVSNFSQGKRTNVHNCIKEGLVLKELKEDADIAVFYDILCENLMKYDAKPIHILDELIEFKNYRLKDEIGFYGIFKGDEMIAGSMMFYFPKVSCAHTQYLAARQAYNKLSPMTFMYYSMLVEMKKKGFSKLSWGIATEDLGKYLNMGLITSKEDFGSSYCNNLTYYYKFK